MNYDCIIIGGGLAGLSAAYSLKKSGKRVLIIESESAIGGRTRSLNLPNRLEVPLGAEFFTAEYKHILDLCVELGIELQQVTDMYTVKFGEQSWKFGYSQIFELIKELGLSNIIKQLVTFPHLIDIYTTPLHHPEKLVEKEKLNLGEFLRKANLPYELTDLVNSVIKLTFHYEHIDQMSAAFGINWLRNILGGKYLVPEGGITSFAVALGSGIEIMSGNKVDKVERDLGKWLVSSSAGKFHAQNIIFATPGNITAKLLPEDLPEMHHTYSLLRNTHYSNLRKIYCEVEPGTLQQGSVYVEKPENDLVEFVSLVSPNIAVIKIRPENYSAKINLKVLAESTDLNIREILTDVKLDTALPIYDFAQMQNVVHYLDERNFTANNLGLAFAGDYIYGPYTESAVYSGLQAAELFSR